MRPQSLQAVEITLLSLLLIFLPWYEAPKNILWGLYGIIWLTHRWLERSNSPSNRASTWRNNRIINWDIVFGLWLLSGILAAGLGLFSNQDWAASLDMFRYISLAWMISRSRYTATQLWYLFLALTVGCVPAIMQAWWTLFVTGKRKLFELHSVGHINHTGIYLGIISAACWARLLNVLCSKKSEYKVIIFWLAVSFLITSALLITSSRAAIGGGAIAMLLLLLFVPRERWFSAKLGGLLIILFSAITGIYMWMQAHHPEMMAGSVAGKFQNNLASKDLYSGREWLWKNAWIAGLENPLFGVGIDKFGKIKSDTACAWQRKNDSQFNCDLMQFSNGGHAHHLYLNTWAERGAVGIAALAVVLLAWPWLLLRTRAQANTPIAAALWGTALGGWAVTAFSGLFNTSLHHEHAIAAVVCLALWLCWLNVDRTHPPATA